MPEYKGAAYGGETKILENRFMRVEVHKRTTGWGWVEIYTPNKKLMGVLPYLSELQDNIGGKRGIMAAPRRLEALEAVEENTLEGESLLFNVHSLTNYEFAVGSFLEYMADKTERPSIIGQIRLTLEPESAVLHMDYKLTWQAYIGSGYVALRGPWLYAGVDSFGMAKSDAIFPGIEWLRSDEWSSNRSYMLAPLAERTAPHPFKVSAPLMAVSHEGDGIGLAWDPLLPLVERRPMTVSYYPQPVFSSPDAVNHANQHLMGLMLPSSATTGIENDPLPKYVTPISAGSTISLKAEVFLSKGTSLDVYTDWVKRHGLPEPSIPRYPLEDALHFIQKAYDTNFWYDDKGWCIRLQRDMAKMKQSFMMPIHTSRYLDKYGDTKLGHSLAKKYEIAKAAQEFKYFSNNPIFFNQMSREEQLKSGYDYLSEQQPDGSFIYNPDKVGGINHGDFAVNIHKPLAFSGETALEQNVVPAIHLLRLAELTGEKKFEQAACMALDFCMDYVVPDGGDVWETPLHSPNILATGHACIAYELAYRCTRKQPYRDKAIYWLRGHLVFTHLWEPRGINDLYCTKPCFCATDWATTSWVDTHVQWEVIQTLATANAFGIDWAEVDPEIDWHRYEKGIACAATHWLLDKSRADELPFDIDLQLGNIDGMLADAHDPVTGQNFGWQIIPDYLSLLIMDILERII